MTHHDQQGAIMAEGPQSTHRPASEGTPQTGARSPGRAPGMLGTSIIFLIAVAAIVVPQILEAGDVARSLGPILGLVLIAIGSVIFFRNLRRQSVYRR